MEKENQKALGRVGEVLNHLSSQLVSHRDLEISPTAANTNSDLTSVFGKVGSVSDEDIVVVSALRTPIGKAKRGGFKDTTPDTLLTAVFKETLNRTKVDGNIVGDIVVGNVQTVGSYSMPARAAMFMAGLPITTTVRSVNRQCSSGLQAVASIASEIKAGYIDVGIGAGVESMTHGGNPSDPSSLPPMSLESIFENPLAKDCLIPMGITSENVAAKYKISREDQDAFSMSSHVKALEAIKNGKFKDEIVPVGDVSQDEGPRETTIDKLAKLKPAFDPKGSTTAGNASQVSDGAAAVLLMKRSQAKKLGLPILGIFRGFKVAGVPPSEMGIGPAFAIPELMKATSQNVSNIDLWEINEAFASQALYCVRKLGIDVKKVNVNGGAIALGHPLGMTGARQVATLLHEMNRRKKEAGGKNGQWKTGVVSMCIGTGMGAAALFEVQ